MISYIIFFTNYIETNFLPIQSNTSTLSPKLAMLVRSKSRCTGKPASFCPEFVIAMLRERDPLGSNITHGIKITKLSGLGLLVWEMGRPM